MVLHERRRRRRGDLRRVRGLRHCCHRRLDHAGGTLVLVLVDVHGARGGPVERCQEGVVLLMMRNGSPKIAMARTRARAAGRRALGVGGHGEAATSMYGLEVKETQGMCGRGGAAAVALKRSECCSIYLGVWGIFF